MPKLDWTESEKATVVRLWREGWTAGRIAAVMPGRSRNAIIGIVHRANQPKRSNPVQTKARTTGQRRVIHEIKKKDRKLIEHHLAEKAKRQVIQFPKPRAAALCGARYQGGDGCQWLDGERPTWRKCGKARFIGSSWCKDHYHRVFQPRKTAETA